MPHESTFVCFFSGVPSYELLSGKAAAARKYLAQWPECLHALPVAYVPTSRAVVISSIPEESSYLL